MGYMIEITESKASELSEHIEKSLRHMGKAMQCVEDMMEESGFGERGGMNRGSRYGNRYEDMNMRGGRGGYMGYRDDEEDDEEEMGERRGMRRRRDSMGRYR